MGSGVSSLVPCFKSSKRSQEADQNQQADLIFSPSEPLDETLGHSFCYVRSSNRFLSPTPSDRFVSPSGSYRFSPSHEPGPVQRSRHPVPEQQTVFKAISGASVSANTSTPRTVLNLDHIYDDATESTLGGGPGYGVRSSIVNANGFESTSSFSALPLQPVPRGAGTGPDPSGPVERSGFFMSGPIERGAMSGPLDPGGPAPGSDSGSVPFSAPLGGVYMKKKKKKKRKKSLSWYPTFSERKQRPWVVPVLNFVGGGRKETAVGSAVPAGYDCGGAPESDLQWALGKAGEDRVHVVVSEEQGWLFVGIYDGFNGPDAPEFLMGNLYRAVYNELQGLFWELDEQLLEEANQLNPTAEADSSSITSSVVEIGQQPKIETKDDSTAASTSNPSLENVKSGDDNSIVLDQERLKKVTFQHEEIGIRSTRRRLWEFLAEEDVEDGLDLSGSGRFAFSVDDAISVSNADSVASRRWLLLSKLKHGLSKHKEGLSGRKLFPWRFGLEDKGKEEVDDRVEERAARSGKRRKVGPIDHELVLSAMSRALETTELAFLEMTDKVLDTNPELALMGSCLLVVLMRDEDVYVMNVGDSRAIVAKYDVDEGGSSVVEGGGEVEGSNEEGKGDKFCDMGENECAAVSEAPSQPMRLTALQLSTDHSTCIEEEVTRIKNEHPDDNQCIVNDRVKGRLKVTRAFGAGFLKQPKLNDALLEMFRNNYIGTAPYVSCTPSLCHHRLCRGDQFLILSSDGLYQYLSNQEVVSLVENFMEKFPEGDPAQHLIEELLVRAAKKAGMDFHELLDIPQGDRRKYHDDVTVMVISLEGRIWKSSGKYL